MNTSSFQQRVGFRIGIRTHPCQRHVLVLFFNFDDTSSLLAALGKGQAQSKATASASRWGDCGERSDLCRAESARTSLVESPVAPVESVLLATLGLCETFRSIAHVAPGVAEAQMTLVQMNFGQDATVAKSTSRTKTSMLTSSDVAVVPATAR